MPATPTNWTGPCAPPPGHEPARPAPSLAGARPGIAGTGHVGRQAARTAHASFGAEILHWNRSPRPDRTAVHRGEDLPYAVHA
ncbi:NAD(P)-dependent oxidoreductase [Streptomyces monashensis]